MVPVTVQFIFQVIYLLVIFLLRVSYGDLQYKCEAGEGDKVQISINKADNNITTHTPYEFMTPDTTCVLKPNNTVLIFQKCTADKDILIKITSPEANEILRKKDVQVYTLRCHLVKQPVFKNVTANSILLKGPPANPSSVHNFQKDWAPQLHMEVTPNSGVIIGQALTVKISSTETKYRFAPQECTATSGLNSQVLWKSDNCNSGDKDLFGFGNWKSVNNNGIEITHDLEAFRFTGSHTLDLGCTVKICPEKMEDQCTLSCTNATAPATTPGSRRRRDIHPRTTLVQTTLNVADSFQDFPNSGSGPFLATSLVSTAVIMYSVVL